MNVSFLSAILELYSEIAVYIYIYIYIYMLRMTDTVTSQNTDLSSWDILCKETL
jgi:hypothetical protein